MKIDEKVFEIALTQIEGIGPVTSRALISHFKKASNVFENELKDALHINGVSIATVKAIHHGKKDAYKKALDINKFNHDRGINTLSIMDAGYPRRLKECYDAPLIMYTLGNGNLNMDFLISIVGTRRASKYGLRICSELIEQSKAYNIGVVSGLAYGIDIEAHKQCLYHQIPTFGTLAHGLDRIYPAAHRSIAHQMIDNGALITEFPQGTTPDRENFPKRNRIVAGMTDATIVVESGLKGGSLITAYLANDYNREVFAFPGNVGSEQSEGTNHLIKVDRARLIENMDDLAYMLNWNTTSQRADILQTKPSINLNEQEQNIITYLSNDQSIHVDELASKTQLGVAKLAPVLINLELMGLVESVPGNKYILI